VPARRVHEQLQRVEGARRGGRRLGGGDGGADDDVALVERDAQRRDLVLGQLVLVGEGLQVALVDETALGGLLEQAIGRRQIVQVRVSQWNQLFLFRMEPRRTGPARPRRGPCPRFPVGPYSLLIERDHAGVHSQASHFCDSLTRGMPPLTARPCYKSYGPGAEIRKPR
jgi:hypothetical protein